MIEAKVNNGMVQGTLKGMPGDVAGDLVCLIHYMVQRLAEHTGKPFDEMIDFIAEQVKKLHTDLDTTIVDLSKSNERT